MDTRNAYDSNRKRPKKRKMNRRSRRAIGCLAFILAGALCVAGIGSFVIRALTGRDYKYLPEWDRNRLSVAVEGTAVPSAQSPAVYENGLYFSVDFVKNYIDGTIFWEAAENVLTVTNANSVIRLSTDELTYYVNNEELTLHMPLTELDGGVYMPESMLTELYGVTCNYNEDEKIVMLDFSSNEKMSGEAAGRSSLYYGADTASENVYRIKAGEKLAVYGEDGDFYRVRAENGVVGYIERDRVAKLEAVPAEAAQSEPKEAWKPENGRITMVWDQIFKASQNNTDAKREPIDGLDVISPTWFAIADTEGNVSNIADSAYVDWAHSNGYQVWALLSNSFDPEITHEVLSRTELRDKVIRQTLAYAALYDLDGINIDFESVNSADGEYYVQFIREITPYLKAQGLVVSVDMYVPRPFNAYYSMEEVGGIVDYVVLMAYDEHWSTSPESGSVASLGWTAEAVQTSLGMVPAEKLIMGAPFYTRVWEEKTAENGETTVSSSSLGMTGGMNNLRENGADVAYDESTGQNYGEYRKDGALYRIWLEDETSMQKRLDIVNENNLAGFAGWKRGLEADGTWKLINSQMKQ